jgi:hypothetical protein
MLGTLNRPPGGLFKPNETFKTRSQEGMIVLPCPALPSKELGTMMVDSFYTHIQARYAFVDWRKLRGWLARQDELVLPNGVYNIATPEGKEASTASFFIW